VSSGTPREIAYDSAECLCEIDDFGLYPYMERPPFFNVNSFLPRPGAPRFFILNEAALTRVPSLRTYDLRLIIIYITVI